jgi:hypothetical protein
MRRRPLNVLVRVVDAELHPVVLQPKLEHGGMTLVDLSYRVINDHVRRRGRVGQRMPEVYPCTEKDGAGTVSLEPRGLLAALRNRCRIHLHALAPGHGHAR